MRKSEEESGTNRVIEKMVRKIKVRSERKAALADQLLVNGNNLMATRLVYEALVGIELAENLLQDSDENHDG